MILNKNLPQSLLQGFTFSFISTKLNMSRNSSMNFWKNDSKYAPEKSAMLYSLRLTKDIDVF